MEWDSHDLQGIDRRDIPALQVTIEICPKYNGTERDSLIAVQGIVEDGISSIPSGVGLTDQLDEKRRLVKLTKKKYKTKVSRLTVVTSQYILM